MCLVRLQGLEHTSPFIPFIEVAIPRYSLWYSLRFDIIEPGRALSRVNLAVRPCSQRVTHSSKVRVGVYKAMG